tara:strand:- start:510 stop:632 length:123 start_codon:yes stop_codon:yes gene_type:complete
MQDAELRKRDLRTRNHTYQLNDGVLSMRESMLTAEGQIQK